MTIQKPDFNQIFASQAPDVDKPAVFNNYNGGMGDEYRPNNGKPTIKGFNFIQNLNDKKFLWMVQNGTFPYDPEINYSIGAIVLKDGKFQKWDGSNWVDFIKLDDSQITTWSGLTQEEKNRDFITPIDYEAKGDGVTDDTQAFANLELENQGKIIDLLGKTYIVDFLPTQNTYQNGYFVVNGIKQYSNNKLKTASDLNLNKREIVATLRTYYSRDDYYQSVCYKDGIFYAIARRSGSESDRTEKMSFFAHQSIGNNPIVSCDLMSAETNMIGHQGLDWGYENGTARFFASMGFAELNNGLYIVSFDAPTINGGACANFVKYKVLKDTDPISKTSPTNISFSRDKSLFAIMSSSREYSNQAMITIFKSDLLKGDEADISGNYLYKFYVPKIYNVSTVGVCQDIAVGDDRVYMSYNATKPFIDTFDFDGNFISREYHEVGKYYAEQLQTGGYSYEYEPEALVWVNDTLCLHAVLGYSSSLQRRANTLFTIDQKKTIERSPKNKVVVADNFKVEAQNDYLQRDVPLQVTTNTVTMIADATAGFYVSKFDSPRQAYTLSANSVIGNGKSPYIGFYRDDDTSALSGSLALMCGKNGGGYGVHVDANNIAFSSAINNTLSLGRSASLWKDIYSTNGVIQTSDERYKQQFRTLHEAEKSAALAIKNAICMFKFNDAVDLKGDGARWHCGVKAQKVTSILESHDLNPFDYAFVCFDEWEEQEEIIESWSDEYAEDDIYDDENEESTGELVYKKGDLIREAGSEIIQEYREAGSRYAIRYDELSMFILSAI